MSDAIVVDEVEESPTLGSCAARRHPADVGFRRTVDAGGEQH